jgi:CheY-like chemotaxis protein
MVTIPMLLIVSLAVGNNGVAVVIDDNVEGRGLFALILTLEGYSVTACDAWCDAPGATLIMVDAIGATGQFVGADIIRQMRTLHPNAYIVGMSAANIIQAEYLGQVNTVEAHMYAAGANIVLNKPFDVVKMLLGIPK